jgi:hypothetical protein
MKMTDKDNMLREVEDLLGADGSKEQARAMFVILEDQGYIYFTPYRGYVLDLRRLAYDDAGWCALLIESDALLARCAR